MKILNVGIIGQGRSGFAIHANNLKLMTEQYKIAAVCDIDEDRLEFIKNEIDCDRYTDYKELLKRDDLDIVVNSTPSHLHLPIGLEILESGHNLLCEKPLARRVSEVDALINKSKETGKLFAIFQQSRFAPYFTQVKKVIDSGVLGKIITVKIAFSGFDRRWDWQTVKEFNGGNLLNTGPHPMDQALQIFGTDMMPEVFCLMNKVNSFGDAEDDVKVILHGKGRPTIEIDISSCDAYPYYTYHVNGTNGGLTGKMDHMEWKYFKPEEAPHQELQRGSLPDRGYCSETLNWYEDKWDVPEDRADLFTFIATTFYKELYKTIIEGAPLKVTHEQVRQQIAVIEECHRQNEERLS